MTTLAIAFLNGLVGGIGIVAVVFLGMKLHPGLTAATRHRLWWIALAATLLSPIVPLLEFSPDIRGSRPATRIEQESERVVEAAVEPLSSDSAAPGLLPVRFENADPLKILIVLWATVSTAALARIAVSVVFMEALKGRARSLSIQSRERVRLLAGRDVRVAAVDIPSPCAAGPFRPTVLIPTALLRTLNEEELEMICRHEAAHFRRRDDISLLVQRIVEAVFVLHPIVRWIGKRIATEREIACDDIVIESVNRHAYARCLARVAESSRGGARPILGLPITRGAALLERRIDMILTTNRPRGTFERSTVACLAGLLLVLSTAAARVPQLLELGDPVPLQVPRETNVEVGTEAPRSAAPPQAAETAAEETLQLQVSVRDRMNRSVTHLSAEHFRVRVDGVARDVSDLTEISVPPAFAVLIDAGDGDAQEVSQRTLLHLASSLGAQGRAVAFSVGALPVEDALAQALDFLEQSSEPRGIMILTEAYPNTSVSSIQDDLDRLNARTYRIFVGAGQGSPVPASFELDAENAARAAELPVLASAIYKSSSIARGLGAAYSLSVVVPARRDTERQVDVEVVPPPGLPPLMARRLLP